MKINLYPVLTLLLGSIPALPFGQNRAPSPPSLKAAHYGVEHGLSQGSNYFMLKDSRNFYWFSSYEGLNRFDGRHFHRFYPNPNDSTALLGAETLGMVEDAHGNIWVGTEQCLNRYDRLKGKFSSFFSKNEKGETTHSQTHPFYADSTEVWFANDRDGIVRFDFLTGEKEIIDSSLRYRIDYFFNFRVRPVARGEFWMVQEKGLAHVNWNTKKKDWYFSGHPQNIAGSPSEIFAYCLDNQAVWIATKAGLARLDPRSKSYQFTESPFDFSKNIIYSIQVDKAGRVWLGTADAGVVLFDPIAGKFEKLADLLGQPRRYAETQVAALNYEPSDNLLWVNTEPHGLDKVLLDVGSIRSHHDDPQDDTDLNAPVVRCFTEDGQGRIWLGVWDGGVNVFDPKTGQFEYHLHDPADPNTLPDKTVLGTCTDQQGRIWAATENGVACFEQAPSGKGRWRRYFNESSPTDRVNANLCVEICALPDGTLAVGTNNGLFQLDPATGFFAPMGNNPGQLQMARNILHDPESDRLFVTAHFNGFWVFEKKGGQWLEAFNGLKGNSVNCFYLKPGSNDLWVGTSQGLAKFDLSTRQHKLYTVADGLPSNCIYGILADDGGRLWASTNRGITCFDPLKNSFENYSPADGCQGYEYNINAFYRASWGELYFGGVSGFDRFLPSEIAHGKHDFPVYLTDFQVNNQPFQLDTVIGEAKEIRLRHFENTFSIRFAALDWQSDGRLDFRFRLPPHLPDWIAADNGAAMAQFINVPPGDYRFEVQAAGGSGHWSSQSASVRISIVPAFWQTGWFKILSTLLFLGLVSGFIAFYVKTRYRLRIADAEKAVEAERLRTRIAQDIHDEVGGSLTKISLAAQVAARLPDLDEPALKSRMEKLGKEARLAADQLREIVFAINPDYDRFEEMQAYFRETACDFWSETDVTPHFDFGENSSASPIVPPDLKRQLLLIFKEAQNNVAKHAGAKNVWLAFRLEADGSYLLAVRDDGEGFTVPEKNGHTNGLTGMKKRATSIGADIMVESSLGAGTLVRVRGRL